MDAGRGAVGLEGFRALAVRGADAERFLQDLLTADVARLEPGAAVRSLLLGPTGRIRADLHVLRRADGYLLLQSPDQPRPVAELLEPYVLSADVVLAEEPPPPLLGVPSAGPWRFVPAGSPGLVPVSPEDHVVPGVARETFAPASAVEVVVPHHEVGSAGACRGSRWTSTRTPSPPRAASTTA